MPHYRAETHQYGFGGLTEKPMLIREGGFSGVVRALDAESVIFRSLANLAALKDWIDAGASWPAEPRRASGRRS